MHTKMDPNGEDPNAENDDCGFRIAGFVAPAVPSVGPVGLILGAVGILGAFGYHRRHF